MRECVRDKESERKKKSKRVIEKERERERDVVSERVRKKWEREIECVYVCGEREREIER